jgi:hypothetical protein
MRALTLVLVSACGASEPAPAAPASSESVPMATEAPPSLGELRQLLSPHEARSFDAAALERGCSADQSLGAYLAMLVENGSPSADGDIHRLEGGCTTVPPGAARAPVDPPVDPAFWDCRIEAFSSDPAGESPWRYELRFRVRRADRTVDLEHLSCPGA